MPKKGNGYDHIDVVVEARKKCGCSLPKFFACAGRFANAIRFDAVVEVGNFERLQAEAAAHPGCRVSPIAVAFANWVLIKEVKDIKRRSSCDSGSQRLASSAEEVLSA